MECLHPAPNECLRAPGRRSRRNRCGRPASLGGALRKARIDLDVEVTFAPGTGPAPGRPPRRIFYRATIDYPSGPANPAGGGPGIPPSTGTLLYVKNHLPASAPADVLAYKAAHAAFPHDTTGNQFFTESQFESYRRLGEHLASV